jgi:hypothetical protein
MKKLAIFATPLNSLFIYPHQSTVPQNGNGLRIDAILINQNVLNPGKRPNPLHEGRAKVL